MDTLITDGVMEVIGATEVTGVIQTTGDQVGVIQVGDTQDTLDTIDLTTTTTTLTTMEEEDLQVIMVEEIMTITETIAIEAFIAQTEITQQTEEETIPQTDQTVILILEEVLL